MAKPIKWNDKEKKLLAAFPAPGVAVTIEDLARVCFASVGVASNKRGNSWVRNSLRKPVQHKLVTQMGRGVYCLAKRWRATSSKRRKPTAKPKNSAPKKTTEMASTNVE